MGAAAAEAAGALRLERRSSSRSNLTLSPERRGSPGLRRRSIREHPWLALPRSDSLLGFVGGSSVPLLGTLCSGGGVSGAGGGHVWEQTFSEFELAFLQGHRVGQVKLLPGTCYIEMARAMVRQLHGIRQRRSNPGERVRACSVAHASSPLCTQASARASPCRT